MQQLVKGRIAFFGTLPSGLKLSVHIVITGAFHLLNFFFQSRAFWDRLLLGLRYSFLSLFFFWLLLLDCLGVCCSFFCKIVKDAEILRLYLNKLSSDWSASDEAALEFFHH
jgi:hypothetical protein